MVGPILVQSLHCPPSVPHLPKSWRKALGHTAFVVMFARSLRRRRPLGRRQGRPKNRLSFGFGFVHSLVGIIAALLAWGV